MAVIRTCHNKYKDSFIHGFNMLSPQLQSLGRFYLVRLVIFALLTKVINESLIQRNLSTISWICQIFLRFSLVIWNIWGGFTENQFPTHGVQLSHLCADHTNWDRRWAITISNPPLGSLLQHSSVKCACPHRSNTRRLLVDPNSQLPFCPASVPKGCITFPIGRQCHYVQWLKYHGIPKLSFEHSLAALNCTQMLGSLNNIMWPGKTTKTLERKEAPSYHWPSTRNPLSFRASKALSILASTCRGWTLPTLAIGLVEKGAHSACSIHQIEECHRSIGQPMGGSESRGYFKKNILEVLNSVSFFVTTHKSQFLDSKRQYGMLNVHSIEYGMLNVHSMVFKQLRTCFYMFELGCRARKVRWIGIGIIETC